MSYCQFHPLEAATWNCPHCIYGLCDSCVDEGHNNKHHLCMACNGPVQSLGSVHSAIPFWRRLEESFRYPIKGDALALIIGLGLLDAAFSNLPLGFLLQLLLLGVVLSYSFECLRQTASGNMVAPDINKSYENGVEIMVRLYLILAAEGFAVSLVYMTLGAGFSYLFGSIFLLATPAVIIIFSLTESATEAIDPRAVFRLITAVGMPYGLIIGFIMIMVSSVEVISHLVGALPFLATSLESVVGNYYTIVLFHIMGYMIFQNQGELGYAAREDHGESKKVRPEAERLKCRIQVLLKEGRYQEMADLYGQAIKASPDDKTLVEDCFRFLVNTNNREELEGFASFYLELLIRNRQEEQLPALYKRVALVIPDYLPDRAGLRHALARSLFERGDFKAAARLLNGLHTAFPDYKALDSAYALMAQCLDGMPNMQSQAEKYRQFAKKLETKAGRV